MKVFFKLKLVSIFVTSFLIFNIISLILINVKNNKVDNFGIVAQFFSVKNFSTDIVGKMFLQKIQKHKKDNKANKKEQNNNQNNLLLLSGVQIISSINFEFNNFAQTLSIISLYTYNLKTILNYPLKIPFWRIIFLLLILKILFNVLPRSISINYNKKYIEGACIV